MEQEKREPGNHPKPTPVVAGPSPDFFANLPPLTVRETEVAAKAALQWLIFVDTRREERLEEEEAALASKPPEEEQEEAKDSMKSASATTETETATPKCEEIEQIEKPLDKENDASESSSSDYLTFREIEVASKAAMKWLQFVDDRILAREAEKIEKNKVIQRRLSMGLRPDLQIVPQELGTGQEESSETEDKQKSDKKRKTPIYGTDSFSPENQANIPPHSYKLSAPPKMFARRASNHDSQGLSFREIEVASKAAVRWLQLVDERMLAREQEKKERSVSLQRRLSRGLRISVDLGLGGSGRGSLRGSIYSGSLRGSRYSDTVSVRSLDLNDVTEEPTKPVEEENIPPEPLDDRPETEEKTFDGWVNDFVSDVFESSVVEIYIQIVVYKVCRVQDPDFQPEIPETKQEPEIANERDELSEDSADPSEDFQADKMVEPEQQYLVPLDLKVIKNDEPSKPGEKPLRTDLSLEDIRRSSDAAARWIDKMINRNGEIQMPDRSYIDTPSSVTSEPPQDMQQLPETLPIPPGLPDDQFSVHKVAVSDENRKLSYMSVADIHWSADAAARWVHRVLLTRMKLEADNLDPIYKTEGQLGEPKPLGLFENLDDPSDSPDIAHFGLVGLPSGPDDGENLERRTQERMEIVEPEVDAVRDSNKRGFYRYNINDLFGPENEEPIRNPFDTFQCSVLGSQRDKDAENEKKGKNSDTEYRKYKKKSFERWVNFLHLQIMDTALTTFYFHTMTKTHALSPGVYISENDIESFNVNDETFTRKVFQSPESSIEVKKDDSPLHSLIAVKQETPTSHFSTELEAAPVPIDLDKFDDVELEEAERKASTGKHPSSEITKDETKPLDKKPATPQEEPESFTSETTFTLSEIQLTSKAAERWISRLFREDQPPEDNIHESELADPKSDEGQKQVKRSVFPTSDPRGPTQVFAYEIPGLQDNLTLETIFAFVLNVPFTHSVVRQTNACIDIDQEVVLKEEFDLILKQFPPIISDEKFSDSDNGKQESETSEEKEFSLDFDVIEIFVRRPARWDSTIFAQTSDKSATQDQRPAPKSVNEIIEIRFGCEDYGKTSKTEFDDLGNQTPEEKSERKERKISPWNQIYEDADEARRYLSPMRKSYKSISEADPSAEDRGGPRYSEDLWEKVESEYGDSSDEKWETPPEDTDSTSAEINLSPSEAAEWISRLFKEDEPPDDYGPMLSVTKPEIKEVELPNVGEDSATPNIEMQPDLENKAQVYAYEVEGLAPDITIDTIFTFVLNLPFTRSVVQQTEAAIDINQEVVLKEEFDSILKQFPNNEDEVPSDSEVKELELQQNKNDELTLDFDVIEIFVRRPVGKSANAFQETSVENEGLEDGIDAPENVNEIIEIRYVPTTFDGEDFKPKLKFELPKDNFVALETQPEGGDKGIDGGPSKETETPKSEASSRRASQPGNELSLKDTQRVAKAAAKWLGKLLSSEEGKDGKYVMTPVLENTDKIDETVHEPILGEQADQDLKSELPSVCLKTDEILKGTISNSDEKTVEPEEPNTECPEEFEIPEHAVDRSVGAEETSIDEVVVGIVPLQKPEDGAKTEPEDFEKVTYSTKDTERAARAAAKWLDKVLSSNSDPDVLGETSNASPGPTETSAPDQSKLQSELSLKDTQRVARAAAIWLGKLLSSKNDPTAIDEELPHPGFANELPVTQPVDESALNEATEGKNLHSLIDDGARALDEEIQMKQSEPEELITYELSDDAETGTEKAINYDMILSLEPWETFYTKKERDVVVEDIKIYKPREKFEVESVQPISFISIKKDIEEKRKILVERTDAETSPRSTTSVKMEEKETNEGSQNIAADKTFEDDPNSNVFRFCRFFGVREIAEEVKSFKPGAVYFGYRISSDETTPKNKEGDPSIKVQKNFDPSEPLDFFYFCKDPNVPEHRNERNVVKVDFTVNKSEPIESDRPLFENQETPENLTSDRGFLEDTDRACNVFRFYIWPSDDKSQETTENTEMNQGLEDLPAKNLPEDDPNSNVFKFCKFFGVREIAEEARSFRPGTIYFGSRISSDETTPQNRDEHPSIKVQKNFDPKEPLDFFYFCKDPSVPEHPNNKNVVKVDFAVIKSEPVEPDCPSFENNETTEKPTSERRFLEDTNRVGNVFSFYIWPSDDESQKVAEADKVETPEGLKDVDEPKISDAEPEDEGQPFSSDIEELIVMTLIDDTESGFEEGINYDLILKLEPWETYYPKKDHENVSEEIKIYAPREKFEVESVQPINFLSIKQDIEESKKNEASERSTTLSESEKSNKDQIAKESDNDNDVLGTASKSASITVPPESPSEISGGYQPSSPKENEAIKKFHPGVFCDERDEDSFKTVSEDESVNLPLNFHQQSPAKESEPILRTEPTDDDISSSVSSLGPDGISDANVSHPEPKFHSTLENPLIEVELSVDNISDPKIDPNNHYPIEEEEDIPVTRSRDVVLEMSPDKTRDYFREEPMDYVSLPIELETLKNHPENVVIDIMEDPKHVVDLRSENHTWKSGGFEDRFSDPTLDEDDQSIMSQPTDTILSASISLKHVPGKTSHGTGHVFIPMDTVNEPENPNTWVTANNTMSKSNQSPLEFPSVSKIHHQSTPNSKLASSFFVTFNEDDVGDSDSVASSDIFGSERLDSVYVSDFEVEIFCYTAIGETSMIDVPTLEVLCFLSAIKVEPIVHSVHSYETLCQEQYPKYVIRKRKHVELEHVYHTSHDVMMFFNFLTSPKNGEAMGGPRSGPSCRKALEYLDTIRLGIIYSLFFHADNFQQIVVPFFAEVLPFVSAVTKPQTVQEQWSDVIEASGKTVSSQLMLASVEAMIGMCFLMEGEGFPYKEEIRRVFLASIIQLHLVKHVEAGSPFGAFLTRKHWLCDQAEKTYRKFERFLPRVKWCCPHVTKRQQQISSSTIHLLTADSSPVSNTVSVHSCPGPDNLPSWNFSCLKTIVLLRGMGFPVTVRPCSHGESSPMMSQSGKLREKQSFMYRSEGLDFANDEMLMEHLQKNFAIDSFGFKYKGHTFVKSLLKRLREIVDQMMWEHVDNYDLVVSHWKMKNEKCVSNDKCFPRVNQTQPLNPSDNQTSIEAERCLGYLSGILGDKAFLHGTSQPSENDAELFSILALPLMNEFPWNPVFENLARYPNIYFFMADLLRNYVQVEPSRTFNDIRLSKVSSAALNGSQSDIKRTPHSSSSALIGPANFGSELIPWDTSFSDYITCIYISCFKAPPELPSLDPDCLYAAIFLGVNDIPTKFITSHNCYRFCLRRYPAFIVKTSKNRKHLFYDVHQLIEYVEVKLSETLPQKDDSNNKALSEVFLGTCEEFLTPAVNLHLWKVNFSRHLELFTSFNRQCFLSACTFHRQKKKVMKKTSAQLFMRYKVLTDNEYICLAFTSAEGFLRDVCGLLGSRSNLCGTSYTKLDARISGLLLVLLLGNIGSSSITRLLQLNTNLKNYLHNIYRTFIRHHLLYLGHFNSRVFQSVPLDLLQLPITCQPLRGTTWTSRSLSGRELGDDPDDVALILENDPDASLTVYTAGTPVSNLPTLDHECIQMAVLFRSRNIKVSFDSRASKLSLQPHLPAFAITHPVKSRILTREEVMDLSYRYDRDIGADLRTKLQILTTGCELKLLPAVLYTLWAISENFESTTLPWFSKQCFEADGAIIAIRKRNEVVRWIQEEIEAVESTFTEESFDVIGSALGYLTEVSNSFHYSPYLLGQKVSSLDAQLFAFLFILTEINLPVNPLLAFIERDTNLQRFIDDVKTKYFTESSKHKMATQNAVVRMQDLLDVTIATTLDENMTSEMSPLILLSPGSKVPLLCPVIVRCYTYKSRIPTLDFESLQLATALAFVHIPVSFKLPDQSWCSSLNCVLPVMRNFELNCGKNSLESRTMGSFLSSVTEVYNVHPDSWLSSDLMFEMQSLTAEVITQLVPYVNHLLWDAYSSDVTNQWFKQNLAIPAYYFRANNFLHAQRAAMTVSKETLYNNYLACCQKLYWYLNQNVFLLGSRPCTLDALVFAHLAVMAELDESLHLHSPPQARNRIHRYLNTILSRYVLLNPGFRSSCCRGAWALGFLGMMAGLSTCSVALAHSLPHEI